MHNYQPDIKIGYLGGGQLARMLCESAANMGLRPHVLSDHKMDPAAQVTGFWQQGKAESLEDLKAFLKSVDVATFESEFLNSQILTVAQKETNTLILPLPEIMAQIQDRKSQKEIFDKYQLPTAPWVTCKQWEDAELFIAENSLPVVFKKRFFGYDGYGTFIIGDMDELENFRNATWKDDQFIVEKAIRFNKECAVILGRSRDGSFTHFPFVESHQTEARCDWVKGPIKLEGQKPMIRKLRAFLDDVNYVGVLAVEFFLSKKGLIINEVAPRVHNTGHYSLMTEGPSQFDIHNMCLLGLELPKKIEIKKGFAMANLIGSGVKSELQAIPGLTWYGKSENRAGRKMGHINTLSSTPDKALKLALKRRKQLVV